jgi:hypothetical protein
MVADRRPGIEQEVLALLAVQAAEADRQRPSGRKAQPCAGCSPLITVAGGEALEIDPVERDHVAGRHA